MTAARSETALTVTSSRWPVGTRAFVAGLAGRDGARRRVSAEVNQSDWLADMLLRPDTTSCCIARLGGIHNTHEWCSGLLDIPENTKNRLTNNQLTVVTSSHLTRHSVTVCQPAVTSAVT